MSKSSIDKSKMPVPDVYKHPIMRELDSFRMQMHSDNVTINQAKEFFSNLADVMNEALENES